MNKQSNRPIPTSLIKSVIDVLDTLLTSEEIDFLLKMGINSYKRAELEALYGVSEDNFPKIFENLIKKGFIWSTSSSNGEDLFEMPPMMVGLFELQIPKGNETPQDTKFLKSLTKLFKSFEKFNFIGGRTLLNMYYKIGGPFWSIAKVESKQSKDRTINVNDSIDVPETSVLRAGTVNEIVEKYGKDGNIAVSNCICRQHVISEGGSCRLKLPRETHMWLGKVANHVIKHKLGREISKSEALEILKDVREKGGIHEIMYHKMDPNDLELSICNCCWDCCNSIGAYNRGQIPLYIKSNYLSTIPDISKCTGCENCIDYCPILAISMKNGKAIINEKKCIGCGQCEYHCPEDAFKLIKKTRTVFLPVLKKSKARISS
ncbi:MAG: 4Fe-4S binding protein [Candidatus Helarchaeota archaeon]